MVVTCSHEPYSWIIQAIESVLNQTHTTRPITVCDGPLEGASDRETMSAIFKYLDRSDRILSVMPHKDNGDWARTVGALHAAAAGYDAIGFLDGDNWLEPTHVEKLLALEVDIATSSRLICHEDGRTLGVDGECDGVRHVDTSCFLFRPKAFGILAHWSLIPRPLSPLCDRVFWKYAQALIGNQMLTHAHSADPTVHFRSRYEQHYRAAGLEPPPGAKAQIKIPSGEYRLPFPFEQEISVP